MTDLPPTTLLLERRARQNTGAASAAPAARPESHAPGAPHIAIRASCFVDHLPDGSDHLRAYLRQQIDEAPNAEERAAAVRLAQRLARP